jgi:flagellar biosynthesis GTPase FlhF
MSKRSKGDQVLSAFEGYDEGLRLLMEESERRAEESRLSPQERKKLAELRRKEEERKRKAKEKAEAQKANRVLTYIPTNLRETIEDIATNESVSMAQVITFFLFEAVERYQKNEIGFWGYKHPSKSPRYSWNLVHPNDNERNEKIGSRKNKKSW